VRERAGLDDRRVDAKRLDLVTQRLGQAVERELRRIGSTGAQLIRRPPRREWGPMTSLRFTRSAIAAVIAVTFTLLALALLSSASADPPSAAAGTTSHGFLAKRGVLIPIDHPRATTDPVVPQGQAGTATTGINDGATSSAPTRAATA
jgi:hypothetical protein